MIWHVVLCTDGESDTQHFTVDSVETWHEWLHAEHPRLMRHDAFAFKGERFLQQGTGYYWSTIEAAPDQPTWCFEHGEPYCIRHLDRDPFQWPEVDPKVWADL